MPDFVRRFGSDSFPMVLIALGVLLIAASFLPLASLVQNSWTRADSQAFGRISQEMHHPSQGNLNDEQLTAHRHELQREFDALQAKLERAQQEPERCRRILLWTGACLTATGAMVHLARQRE
jgi:hypothetical protein